MGTADDDGPLALLAATWPALTSAQARLHEVRERTHRNFDGGDAGHQWDTGLVRRHAVNYAVAAQAAREVTDPGPVVDVGAGAGAFSVWLAEVLGRPLVLVDRDPGHRELAARAFPHATVLPSTQDADAAPVVLLMEVIEHIPRDEQAPFLAEVAALVRPGGLLAVSTPDESGYWGGWSGYPPHVAPLTAGGLTAVLAGAAAGWDLAVLRLGGPDFDLSPVGRYGVPVANRVWGTLERRVPRVTHEVAYRINQLGKRRPAPAPPAPGVYSIGPAARGRGTGLVALARRPA